MQYNWRHFKLFHNFSLNFLHIDIDQHTDGFISLNKLIALFEEKRRVLTLKKIILFVEIISPMIYTRIKRTTWNMSIS